MKERKKHRHKRPKREVFPPAAAVTAATIVKIRNGDGSFESIPRVNLTPEQSRQADITATDRLRHLLKNRR